MDDLPELPFEKVLSYLSLEDRLKVRAVSRRWYHTINRFKVKTLCYSSRPSGFIYGKSRWVSDAYVENFISSIRFASFFNTFGQTILSSLKHLRLCEIDLNGGDPTVFTRILKSFSQLEELDIIQTRFNRPNLQFNLNLPMLTSLQLEYLEGIQKLTLEAPRLREVKILHCSDVREVIVHGESVERLLVDWLEYTEVKKLKNLQFLYVEYLPRVDATFLSSLQNLKEIHMQTNRAVSELFEQKQRFGRTDLKIYLCGLLLNGPDDPAINDLRFSSVGYLSGELLVCLAKNSSRRADKILFYNHLHYSEIEEFVAPGLEVDLLKLFTDPHMVKVNRPVQNIQRFLDLLKNLQHISSLEFRSGNQQQDLFDRLPEYCAVQKLFISIDRAPSDLAFLFRLKHLIKLIVHWSIETETVRRAFEELPFLSSFYFRYDQKGALIEIDQSKEFRVWVGNKGAICASDLNAAIEFIESSTKIERLKRKVEDP